MMTRAERAKQFIPFDAMKGLQEALRDREERNARTEKRIISDEIAEHNSMIIQRIEKGMTVVVSYFSAFHDIKKHGRVTEINRTYKFLRIDEEQIYFDNIYSIKILEFN